MHQPVTGCQNVTFQANIDASEDYKHVAMSDLRMYLLL